MTDCWWWRCWRCTVWHCWLRHPGSQQRDETVRGVMSSVRNYLSVVSSPHSTQHLSFTLQTFKFVKWTVSTRILQDSQISSETHISMISYNVCEEECVVYSLWNRTWLCSTLTSHTVTLLHDMSDAHVRRSNSDSASKMFQQRNWVNCKNILI